MSRYRGDLPQAKPLDAKGRYTDAEVIAVAARFGVLPKNQADVDRIMGSMLGTNLVLKMRMHALWDQASPRCVVRLVCWLGGGGKHEIDLLGAAYGPPWACARCGKVCHGTREVARP